MNKAGPGFGRIFVMAAFALSCFGLLLFLWLAFGGPIPLKPQGYQVKVSFERAAQLAEQAEVRISGVPVGKVVRKELDPDGNRMLATIELESDYAPMRADARAILRQKTLLGEIYVELSPGSPQAPAVAEGGRLANGQVERALDLEDVLQIFDEPTRDAFRTWQRVQAKALEGRGGDFNAALGNLPVFVEGATDVVETLERRRGALRGLVRDTGEVFGALTEDERQLRRLVTETTGTFEAVASRRERLAESIRIFPTFLNESRLTLRRLKTFSRDTDPLLRDLEPALRDLRPTLADVGRLAPHLRSLFRDLDPLIVAGRSGFPALGRVFDGLGPVFEATAPFVAQLNPLLQYLELYQGNTANFLTSGPAALNIRVATNNPNGQGHALPQIVVTGSQSLITPTRSRDNRGNTYLRPGALDNSDLNRRFIYPNWDCVPSGGEKPPTTEGQGDPACFVQGDIPFKGISRRFPHVEAEDYGDEG